MGWQRVCVALWVLSLLAVGQLQNSNQPGGGQNLNLDTNPRESLFWGDNTFMSDNLVEFGPSAGDQKVEAGMLTSGQTVDLHMFFPFYGGLYNYTTISVNGYMSFATVLDHGPTINVGPDRTDWPRKQDPAMIAPYLCKQRIPNIGRRSGVYYRLMLRQSLFGSGSGQNDNLGNAQQSSSSSNTSTRPCPATSTNYVRCDPYGDSFLNEMMDWLQEGVVGAQMFRADAAFVVTWFNTASEVSGSDIEAGQTSTYQVVWLTDRSARLSYVIINYDRLGFDATDLSRNSRPGRCQALFNGGNHTGIVPVDPTSMYKSSPKSLAARSGVPHMARGRYMFRVDDVVRPGGCSNKTGGTFLMMIYPNIVNMLGETTVDVNAMCLERAKSYILIMDQRPIATCMVLNPAIARCALPKIFDWGTKTVYFQPQSGGGNDEKAFVGHIYFVPPTLDPQRLDIGNIHDWFKNPLATQVMPLIWYPRNFTNPDLVQRIGTGDVMLRQDATYSTQLGLYVIGYKESNDGNYTVFTEFDPEHRVIARLGSYSNKNQYEYRWKPQEERINVNQVEEWYIDSERMNELYTYRFGYLKLAPIKNVGQQTPPRLPAGLVSAPISLHWLWTLNNQEFQTSNFSQNEEERRMEFVKKKATELCHDRYNEDGAQWNDTSDDTETNASCPCVETQAILDLGRFMPHPRCSQAFRDITCTQSIGARNCYVSAQNIYGSYARSESEYTARLATRNEQVCCYDAQGLLMQTSYQPGIEASDFSAFHNDYMPYHLCCKYADLHCEMFNMSRPSSGCQEYQPPAYGEITGAGVINTIDNDKFIFNEPGVFTLLYIPKTLTTPEVRIQVRLERYPNRKVDFRSLGRSIAQEDLVQPSNVTVVTGVVLEATGTDRVHVLVRKDTRRFRYRTSVIVGNILRYFDTMQRFKGLLVYVNTVERGQAEIYVALEEAQIGVRIRESFNLDIDRLSNYQESMGMLSVALSVPTQYGVRLDGDKARESEARQRHNLPKVQGLMRPFPEQTMTSSYTNTLNLNDVNSEQYRQQIIQAYRVVGSGEQGSEQNMQAQYLSEIPSENLFLTSRNEDWKFEVCPEVVMKRETIYKAAAKYATYYNRFYPITGATLMQLLNNCRDMMKLNFTENLNRMQAAAIQQYETSCPNKPQEVLKECGDDVACLYHYTLLNSKVIGQQAKEAWNSLITMKHEASQQYKSPEKEYFFIWLVMAIIADII